MHPALGGQLAGAFTLTALQMLRGLRGVNRIL
jgi:hypothetical protein